MCSVKGTRVKKIAVKDLALELVILDLEDDETLQCYLQLFEACFGKRSNIDGQLFKWLNNYPPNYKNLNFAFVDQANGELAAAYGLQPGDAFVNGTIHKYALCTNVMTHPDYAGKGLFVAIGKETLEFAAKSGITFCFGIPNEKAISGHLKVGWNIVNEIRFYEKTFFSTEPVKPVTRVKDNLLDEMTDGDLFALYEGKYDFRFVRTSAWFKWRLNKPHSKYLNFGIQDGLQTGFMVLKEFVDVTTTTKKLHIVDFCCKTEEIFELLLDHCSWVAQQGGYDLLNLWHFTQNGRETEILLSKNFKLAVQKNPVIIHPLGNAVSLPEVNWHVSLFDNDVY